MKSRQFDFAIELFEEKKDYIIFGTFIILMAIFSLFLEYKNFSKIAIDEPISLNAKVLLQYKKPEKSYFVLKLKGENGEIFYTTSRDDLRDLRGREIEIYGKLGADCDFKKYLQSCFVIAYSISLLPTNDFKASIVDYIDSQHVQQQDFHLDSNQNAESSTNLISSPNKIFDEFGVNIISQMYRGLFLAMPIPQVLRESMSALSIAHIFAISGFHLGILSLCLYGILAPPYRYFARKNFSYRNEFYDLNFVILIFAFLYLLILDFTPSFLRSFVMFAFGFYALWRGIKLISFKLLFACVLLILALFPRIFFSIGFWLSVSGIFYIYLYLRHFGTLKINKFSHAILLNFIIFLQMLPIAHYIFYDFSPLCVVSPFVTLGFIIFYPLVLLLHIIGFGGVFDNLLLFIGTYDFNPMDLITPFWLLAVIICFSFIAIFKKFAYYCVVFISILYFASGIWLYYAN